VERTLNGIEIPSDTPSPEARPLAPSFTGTTVSGLRSLSMVAAPHVRRLWPLWRYAWFLGSLFVVSAVAVAVRLDVQQIRKHLDRNDAAMHEAEVAHQRLLLEIDARRRAVAMQGVAAQLGLGPGPAVVHVAAAEVGR
jgi:hypothetical protein